MEQINENREIFSRRQNFRLLATPRVIRFEVNHLHQYISQHLRHL